MPIRPMIASDLTKAKRLFEALHWPYTEDDLSRLYALEPQGWFCAEEDGEYLGQAMGLLMGSEQGAIGLVGVQEGSRKQGLGTDLTRASLDFLLERGATQVRLDATDMGLGIYRELGFETVWAVRHYSKDMPADGAGQDSSAPDSPGSVTHSAPATPSLAQLIEFDARVYGAGRAEVIPALARDSEVLTSHSAGELTGFGMIRPTAEPRGVWVGPVAAASEAAGRELLERAFARYGGHMVRLGVPEPNQAACRLLEQHGFSCDFVLTRMYYGDLELRESPQANWAEAGHEKG